MSWRRAASSTCERPHRDIKSRFRNRGHSFDNKKKKSGGSGGLRFARNVGWRREDVGERGKERCL